jgi:hypothetical protein
VGYIDYTDGAALPASSLDEMSKQGVLVYATTAARDADAALSAVLREGMVCYCQSTDRFYSYNGGWIVTGWTSQGGRVGGQWARNANQSIPNTTQTAISWDNETYDPDGMLTPTATTATTAMAGLYAVSAKLASASTMTWMRIEVGALTWDFTAVGTGVAVSGSFVMPVAASTGILVYVYQATGGAINVTGSLFIHRLGP